MKHSLGALSLLLVGLTTTAVHADYIVIIANLAPEKSNEGGFGFPGGGSMMPGGKGQGPGTGSGGGIGGPLGPPGLPGGGGAGPGSGGPGGGMAPEGGPGGRSGGTGGPPGFGGPPSGMTGPGGFGPPGFGGPGAGGVPGTGNPFNPEEVDDDIPPVYVVQTVDVHGWAAPEQSAMGIALARERKLLKVGHRWGHTILYDGGLVPQSPTDNSFRYVIIHNGDWLGEQFSGKLSELKNASNRERTLLQIAQWCLSRGLTDDTHLGAVMARLGDARKEQPVHDAYKKLKEYLSRPAADNPALANMVRDGMLSTFKVSKSEHFILIHDLTSRDAKDDPPEVMTRLKRLESAYATYYYWLALKCGNDLKLVEKNGKPVFQFKNDKTEMEIRLPEQRLISIMVGTRAKFQEVHKKVFGDLPLGGDGFYAPRSGLAVYSGERLDPLYRALVEVTMPYAGPGLRGSLLRGDSGSLMKDKEHLCSQTAALMLRAMDADSELASVSHDATCQLVTASGLLPRGVVAPQWLEAGIGEYFGTPKGAIAPCATGPNPIYLPHFKKIAKKIDPVSELKNTITNRLWRQTDGGKDGPATLKAETMSWALTYWLAETNLSGLLRYYQELSRLPRDVEFDDEVLLRCFGRAFDLMDKSNPNQLSEERLQAFANEWRSFVTGTVLEEQLLVNKVKELQVKGPPPKPQPQVPQGMGFPPGGGFGGGGKGGGQ